MGLTIQERGEVVQGVPVVKPGDDLFWFNRPRLILHLLNFVLFQVNYYIKSCIHTKCCTLSFFLVIYLGTVHAYTIN